MNVIDKPGEELATDPPPVGGLKTDRGMALVLGAAAAVLTTALFVAMMRN